MYQPQPGIKQQRRQQFLAQQAQAKREQDRANAAAHAAVVKSVSGA